MGLYAGIRFCYGTLFFYLALQHSVVNFNHHYFEISLVFIMKLIIMILLKEGGMVEFMRLKETMDEKSRIS